MSASGQQFSVSMNNYTHACIALQILVGMSYWRGGPHKSGSLWYTCSQTQCVKAPELMSLWILFSTHQPKHWRYIAGNNSHNQYYNKD